MSETADKNTFAGALAQESSHYVTLGNSTITPSICQQFFPSFSIFFSNKKMFPLIVLVVPLIYGYNKKKRKTEEQLLSNMTKRALGRIAQAASSQKASDKDHNQRPHH